MGKQRITQLLEQLKANQEADLQNAAAIFTVAQVAVNKLEEQLPPQSPAAIAALPPAPVTKAELLHKYGSYKTCRSAAKQQGIKFSKTPSWEQLVTGFRYLSAFQQLKRTYLDANPDPNLHGITIELRLDERS